MQNSKFHNCLFQHLSLATYKFAASFPRHLHHHTHNTLHTHPTHISQGHYGDAVALINRSEMVMCQGEPLPIDLRVRRGECGVRGVMVFGCCSLFRGKVVVEAGNGKVRRQHCPRALKHALAPLTRHTTRPCVSTHITMTKGVCLAYILARR